mmetsp:Transcript_40543/g.49180  ORF Transcript_40543/g.49180 Transcript_40543/m.49180 type:complete len:225 (-) Transcript_40543:89-763(-)|eukprot:CAMPEP_0197861796 /NCGR_PEP_ID=MMETSP1438-20131217/38072_1 /TAXON_ID=1461541 /ORGANISM="Pterosperma sp., Strain CCMP1384" /LENGTH=224 /DNA_ID=CAMNT_0043479095 /DNA_START=110 /DNA_END=784 /DNA_ORIENTATION=-
MEFPPELLKDLSPPALAALKKLQDKFEKNTQRLLELKKLQDEEDAKRKAIEDEVKRLLQVIAALEQQNKDSSLLHAEIATLRAQIAEKDHKIADLELRLARALEERCTVDHDAVDKQWQTKLKEKVAECERAQTSLKSAQGKLIDVKAQLEFEKGENTKARERSEKLEENLTEANDEIDELKRQLAEMKAEKQVKRPSKFAQYVESNRKGAGFLPPLVQGSTGH